MTGYWHVKVYLINLGRYQFFIFDERTGKFDDWR